MIFPAAGHTTCEVMPLAAEKDARGAYLGELSHENILEIFGGAADFSVRAVTVGGQRLWLYAIDGLTSGGDISELVLKPLLRVCGQQSVHTLYERALTGEVYNFVALECRSLDDAARKLVNGFCVVLFGEAGALAFEDKTGEKRAPSAPETENTVKGPKDAFTETLRTNTSLLRRHLRAPELRLFETTLGRRSRTNIGLAYLDGLTAPDLVEKMKKRLGEIDIDGALSPASIEEYLTGSRATAFPLLQYTERTDRFAQGLLDGRVGILVDGLPLGYLAPVDLATLMSSAEDRATDFVSASAIRILRYLALLVSLALPAAYIAMVAFHPEMLPTRLLEAIIESKRAVPFSTVLEVLGLLVAFELVQEASIALPQPIGQSLSVIGGLVVGTAAVDAKLISPAALIVVASAGVCGYALPGRDFAAAVRLWRFLLAALAGIGGLFGLTAGAVCLLIHLSGLESLGVPYLAPFCRVGGARALLRSRLVRQKYRDAALHPQDLKNQE